MVLVLVWSCCRLGMVLCWSRLCLFSVLLECWSCRVFGVGLVLLLSWSGLLLAFPTISVLAVLRVLSVRRGLVVLSVLSCSRFGLGPSRVLVLVWSYFCVFLVSLWSWSGLSSVLVSYCFVFWSSLWVLALFCFGIALVFAWSRVAFGLVLLFLRCRSCLGFGVVLVLVRLGLLWVGVWSCFLFRSRSGLVLFLVWPCGLCSGLGFGLFFVVILSCCGLGLVLL